MTSPERPPPKETKRFEGLKAKNSKLEDWMEEEFSAAQKLVHQMLKSSFFEHIMACAITLNFAVVIVETDRFASDEDIPKWVFWSSWGLLVAFVLELGLKIFTLRGKFHKEWWNVFDFIVIGVDLVMSIVGLLASGIGNVSGLRILRLARLARATKVVQVFPELRLMLAGLAGAMNAIFWGTILLFTVLLIWAVIAVQFIHPLNEEIIPPDGCARCPHAFESTFQASLTFFTQVVAGDSWGRETVPIIEKHPATGIFFVAVYLSVGMALLNLILGVVVNVATEERERIMKQMDLEKSAQRAQAQVELYMMCQEMDEDGNEELTKHELERGFANNEAFRATLEKMEIGEQDLDVVWSILDSDQSGTITAREFVDQVYKLKSSESQFMIAYIKFYLTEIQYKLRQGQDKLRTDLKAGQEGLVDKLRAGQHELVKKLRAGQEKLKIELKSHFGPAKYPVDAVPLEHYDPRKDSLASVESLLPNGGDNSVNGGDSFVRPESVESGTDFALAVGASGQPLGDGPLHIESLQLLFEQTRIVGPGSITSARPGSLAAENSELIQQLHGIWEKCITSIEEAHVHNTHLADQLTCHTKCVESVFQCLNGSVGNGNMMLTSLNKTVGKVKARACAMCGSETETTL